MLRLMCWAAMCGGLAGLVGCSAGQRSTGTAPATQRESKAADVRLDGEPNGARAASVASVDAVAAHDETDGAAGYVPRAVSVEELTALAGALDEFPGCLGTERAMTTSGKLAIFAWFENKQALLNWYYGVAHKRAMEGARAHAPLEHVPDDTGPILVITTITPSNQSRLMAGELALSQIAIELYQPLPGGHYFGERFAPEAVRVPHAVDIGRP